MNIQFEFVFKWISLSGVHLELWCTGSLGYFSVWYNFVEEFGNTGDDIVFFWTWKYFLKMVPIPIHDKCDLVWKAEEAWSFF